MDDLDQTAVDNFKEFLRIPSVQPDIDYNDCLTFLKRQAESLQLPCEVVEVHPNKPVLIITWLGREPSLPSIWLNCHMDVVPVFPDKWTHPPFSAFEDSKGNIFARGAQDMKCVGIQYLESIRRLKKQKFVPKRTVHVGFVPDEEIGGLLGMKLFVKTAEFRDLNVGFALDEGMVTGDDLFVMFNGERVTWNLTIHCSGNVGHGSFLLDNTAGEKLAHVLYRYSQFRAEQKRKVDEDESSLCDLVTANLTSVKGGVQTNVIPDTFSAGFDVRLPPECDFDEVEKMFACWCEEAGEGVRLDFVEKNAKVGSTELEGNPFWVAFKGVFEGMNRRLEVRKCPATTDMKFMRQVGIPAFSFSPMCNSVNLIHDHNEYLNKTVFLNGIKIYMQIIPALSNV